MPDVIAAVVAGVMVVAIAAALGEVVLGFVGGRGEDAAGD